MTQSSSTRRSFFEKIGVAGAAVSALGYSKRLGVLRRTIRSLSPASEPAGGAST